MDSAAYFRERRQGDILSIIGSGEMRNGIFVKEEDLEEEQ